MAADQLVLYTVDGKVGVVTINRPDKLNAITLELKHMLIERLLAADADPATSVVVLRAEGRAFSAGYDISPNPARAARRGNALAWHESLTDDIRLEMTPWDMRKPVIASVQGHCLGGGCELMMLCDLAIAADDATFGEPEIRFSNVGPGLVMPFVIGLRRARVVVGARLFHRFRLGAFGKARIAQTSGKTIPIFLGRSYRLGQARLLRV